MDVRSFIGVGSLVGCAVGVAGWLAVWANPARAPSSDAADDHGSGGSDSLVAPILAGLEDLETLVVSEAGGDLGSITMRASRGFARDGCVVSGLTAEKLTKQQDRRLARSYALPGRWQGAVGSWFDRRGSKAAVVGGGDPSVFAKAWAERTASNVRRLHETGRCARTVVVLPTHARDRRRVLANALDAVGLSAAALEVVIAPSTASRGYSEAVEGPVEPVWGYEFEAVERDGRVARVAVSRQIVHVIHHDDPLFVDVQEVLVANEHGVSSFPADGVRLAELKHCLGEASRVLAAPFGPELARPLAIGVRDRYGGEWFELTHAHTLTNRSGVTYQTSCFTDLLGAP